MKRLIAGLMVFVLVAFTSSSYAKEDEGPKIIAEAYFFALEHHDFKGAYGLYSKEFYSKIPDSQAFEKIVTEKIPFVSDHISRTITGFHVEQDKAVVLSFVVDEKEIVYMIYLPMHIEDGLWKIDDTVIRTTGKPSKGV